VPDDDVAELLKTLFEQNEQYHNFKERVVWLAGTIYLTFSALLIAWYVNSDNISLRCSSQKHFVTAFLTLIFALTVTFILRQTREKVRSTMITDQHLKRIGSLRHRRCYADLRSAYDQKCGFLDFIERGWSGLLILGVVCGFYAAQLIVLYEFPKLRLWLPIGIALIVVCIPLPLLVGNRKWIGKQIKKFWRNLKKWFDP
jgi:hypothetical protein